MTTVKLSYSILNAWSRGYFEDAVAMYRGKGIPETPALLLGRAKDELWTDYTMRTRQMHPELGDWPLSQPVVQQKYEKLLPFSDDLQILLRGRTDLVDGHRVFDFKCGVTTPATYLETMQLDYYKMLLPQLSEGYYLCFNPLFGETTVGVKFLTPGNAEAALNHLMTNASEMIDYLQTQKLLRNYERTVT